MESLESIYPSETKPRPLAVGDYLLADGDEGSEYLYWIAPLPKRQVIIVGISNVTHFGGPFSIEDYDAIAFGELPTSVRRERVRWHRITRAEAAKWLLDHAE